MRTQIKICGDNLEVLWHPGDPRPYKARWRSGLAYVYRNFTQLERLEMFVGKSCFYAYVARKRRLGLTV